MVKETLVEFFRLEDRVLFEAAAVAEMVEAMDNDPNADMNESDRQAHDEQNAVKNAPPENPADAVSTEFIDPAKLADLDAEFQKLIDGEIPLFDTADIDPDIDALINDIFQPESDLFQLFLNDNGETVSTGKELVVINSSVMDADAIIDGLAPNQEVLHLEKGSDAMVQILDYLNSSDFSYDAIHIISHGNAGYFVLNGEVFDSSNFNFDDWTAIGEHISDNGDILLYGCNLAESEAGQDFVSMIGNASGADVAASINVTGITGDWELEYTHGLIETTYITVENYNFILTTYEVTSLLDDTSGGTLREAIALANSNSGLDEVVVRVDGEIILTQGEILISDSVNIMGNRIIINGNGERIFYISGGNEQLEVIISDITFKNGTADSGGAIYNDNGNLAVINSTFTANSALYNGGAIYSNSMVTVMNSTISGNSAENGGGIYTTGENIGVELVNSSVIGNMATDNGGGIYGNIDALNSIVVGNYSGLKVANDIYSNDLSMKYSVHGSSNEPVSGTTNLKVTPQDVLGLNVDWSSTTNPLGLYYLVYDGDDNNPVFNGATYAIIAEGAAAYAGTLTARDGDDDFYYRDMNNGYWYQLGDNNTTYGEFIDDDSVNYGLTVAGAMVLTTARNQVSRVITSQAYNIGAYALDTVIPKDSLVVTTETDWLNPFADPVSLREALAYAAVIGGSRTVTFDNGITSITLSEWYGQLNIISDVVVDGGTSKVTVAVRDSGADVAGRHRVFDIADDLAVTLRNLDLYGGDVSENSGDAGGGVIYLAIDSSLLLDTVTVSNGIAQSGGGIYHQDAFENAPGIGAITIVDSIISNNKAVVYYGGGVSGYNITLDEVVFDNNFANNDGGGIYSKHGTITISDSKFSDNRSNGFGGGISVYRGDVIEITDSEFFGNHAAWGGGGGDIWGGKINISNSEFTGNTTDESGGAISFGDAEVILSEIVFSGNSADYSGGAINAFNCTITIEDSKFADNSAGENGGAIAAFSSKLILENSVLNNNSATENGGAVYMANHAFDNSFVTSTLIAMETTFHGNTAGVSGGGIYMASFSYDDSISVISEIIVANSTVSGNTAGVHGDGIYIFSDYISTLSILNSIILGNGSNDLHFDSLGIFNAAYSVYGELSGTYSLVVDIGNVTDATVTEIFGTPILTTEDWLPIQADGRAAYLGTLIAVDVDNEQFYYRNMSNNQWYELNDEDNTYGTFENTAPNYGLTASATVITMAQNQVSRVQTDAAYNIGAYALDTVVKNANVSTLRDWVNNPFDSGSSLREIVAGASDGDIIYYDFGFNELNLTLGEIIIDSDLIFADGFIIAGGSAADNIFNVNNGKTVVFGKVVLNNGQLSGNMNFTDTVGGSAVYTGGNAVYTGTGIVLGGIYDDLSVEGSGQWDLNGDLAVEGDFKIAGGSESAYLTLDGQNYTLALAGNVDVSNAALDNMVFATELQIVSNTILMTDRVDNLSVVLSLSNISETFIEYGNNLNGVLVTAEGTYVLGQKVTQVGFADTTTIHDAGEYDLALMTYVIAGYGNYVIMDTTGKVTVTPREITVVADPQSKLVGEVDPVFTYTYDPERLVAGDSFSGALTRSSGEEVGRYAILQGTLTLGGNYQINYSGNFLTVYDDGIGSQYSSGLFLDYSSTLPAMLMVQEINSLNDRYLSGETNNNPRLSASRANIEFLGQVSVGINLSGYSGPILRNSSQSDDKLSFQIYGSELRSDSIDIGHELTDNESFRFEAEDLPLLRQQNSFADVEPEIETLNPNLEYAVLDKIATFKDGWGLALDKFLKI